MINTIRVFSKMVVAGALSLILFACDSAVTVSEDGAIRDRGPMDSAAIQRGSNQYSAQCAFCHGADGLLSPQQFTGVKGGILAPSNKYDYTDLVAIIETTMPAEFGDGALSPSSCVGSCAEEV